MQKAQPVLNGGYALGVGPKGKGKNWMKKVCFLEENW